MFVVYIVLEALRKIQFVFVVFAVARFLKKRPRRRLHQRRKVPYTRRQVALFVAGFQRSAPCRKREFELARIRIDQRRKVCLNAESLRKGVFLRGQSYIHVVARKRFFVPLGRIIRPFGIVRGAGKGALQQFYAGVPAYGRILKHGEKHKGLYGQRVRVRNVGFTRSVIVQHDFFALACRVLRARKNRVRLVLGRKRQGVRKRKHAAVPCKTAGYVERRFYRYFRRLRRGQRKIGTLNARTACGFNGAESKQRRKIRPERVGKFVRERFMLRRSGFGNIDIRKRCVGKKRVGLCNGAAGGLCALFRLCIGSDCCGISGSERFRHAHKLLCGLPTLRRFFLFPFFRRPFEKRTRRRH